MVQMTAVQHNGRTYTAELGTIESTHLGPYDHTGIWVALVQIDFGGTGVYFCTHRLDRPDRYVESKRSAVGTAFGMDQVMLTLETVGAHSWEQLNGKPVMALFANKGGPGDICIGLANPDTGKVFIPADHASGFQSIPERSL